MIKNNESASEIIKGNHMMTVKSLTRLLLKEVELLKKSNHNSGNSAESEEFFLFKELNRFEINMIKTALRQTGGDQNKAAILLGLDVATLKLKIKHHRIDLKDDPMLNDD